MNHRTLVTIAAAGTLFMATSAESCGQASSQLNKASQGLNALTATCSQLQDSSAASDFAAAEADQANLSSQSVAQTKQAALDAMHKRCASSTNPSYQPYVDVQTDISP
jgi:hypothetical protein